MKLFTGALLAAVLLLFAATHPLLAQNARWTATNGPYGGTTITDLQPHPDGSLYAGTESGLYRSQNGGQSWSQVDTAPGAELVRVLVVLPNGSAFAGTPTGVYRSLSNNTWELAGLPEHSITALDATRTGVVFAGTADGAVYRSEDRGGSWVLADEGMPGFEVTVLRAGSENTILAGTPAGVYRSTDGGASWKASLGGFHSFTINDIVYSPTGGFFACTEEGDIYRSGIDVDGAFWVNILSAGSGVTFRSMHVRSNGEVLVGTLGLILRLSSTGLLLHRAYELGYVIVETITSGSDGALYAGTFGSGIFRSSDSGTSWQTRNEGLGSIVTSLAFDHGGRLFSGTLGGGVFRSQDGGNSWSAVNNGLLNLNIEALAVRGDGEVFVATSGGFIFRTSDHGTSWRNTSFPGFAVRGLFANDAGDVFAGTEGGLFRMARTGTVWQYTGLAGFDIRASAIAPTGEMYASLAGRLMRSPDGGQTWGSAGLMMEVQALAINANGDVFAAPVTGGLWRSINDGEPGHTWDEVGEIFTVLDVRTILFASGGEVVAGTYGGGIFVSENNGDRWIAMSGGLANIYVRNFATDPLNGVMYAATNDGVFRTDRFVTTSTEGYTDLPMSISLSPNYPNPFNPSTTIGYTLERPSAIRLTLYDALGRAVRTIAEGTQAAGHHSVVLDATDLPAGTYLYRLEAEGRSLTRGMTLLK